MSPSLPIAQFLLQGPGVPVADVRSPLEYDRGHIPGSINLPLFSNKEREVIGTLYHKRGREEAIHEAYEIIGPRLNEYTLLAEQIAPGKKIRIYCWRGGMRSKSVGFLLETAGFEVTILENGYKAYRNHILSAFYESRPVVILSGMTGSGKTDILRNLKTMGEQVSDLEGLARHKGSVFGGVGQPKQPSTEQFANDLYEQWCLLDPQKVVWMEDESYKIGDISLPDGIYKKIRESNIVRINMSREARAARLAAEYGQEPEEELELAIRAIEKRIGGLKLKEALEALASKDYYSVAMISLEYYDKSYEFTFNKRPAETVFFLDCAAGDATANSEKVLGFYHANQRKIIINE